MKRTKNLVIMLTMLVVMGTTSIVAFADVVKTAVFADNIGVTINGAEFDAKVVIIDGVSYLPIKVLGYAINAETEWDKANRTVVLTRMEEKVKVEKVSQTLDGKLNKKKAYFSDDIKLIADGERMNKQVVIVEGRSYLPVKAVGEDMGIRAKWDDATRTIKIVNPMTAQVDDSIKDYYVKDLPKVTTQEDYLVGNWQGRSGWSGKGSWTDEVFVEKNRDGTYKITRKGVESNGKYYIVEQKGYFNSTTSVLTTKFVKYIYNGGYKDYIDDSYKLKGDTLQQLSGADWGNLERF